MLENTSKNFIKTKKVKVSFWEKVISWLKGKKVYSYKWVIIL
jgi:hypothetical protein